jgi:hypothetical protein
MVHLVTPRAVVVQQVTEPDLPQVDWLAHFVTLDAQLFGSVLSATASRTMPRAHAT